MNPRALSLSLGGHLFLGAVLLAGSNDLPARLSLQGQGADGSLLIQVSQVSARAERAVPSRNEADPDQVPAKMNQDSPFSEGPSAGSGSPGVVDGLLMGVRPEYPRRSRVQGEQGEVTLSIEVDEAGRVTQARVSRSSGFSRLDRAALEGVREATLPGLARTKRELKILFRLEGV